MANEGSGLGREVNSRSFRYQGSWFADLILRTCQPIVDADDRIIGVLGGMPKNTNWGEVQLEAARAIEAARSQLQFENKDMHHRRGKFAALGVGVSHGGGQKACRAFYRICLRTTHNLPPFIRALGCFLKAAMAQCLISSCR